jgi:hypothetical protein
LLLGKQHELKVSTTLGRESVPASDIVVPHREQCGRQCVERATDIFLSSNNLFWEK